MESPGVFCAERFIDVRRALNSITAVNSGGRDMFNGGVADLIIRQSPTYVPSRRSFVFMIPRPSFCFFRVD